MAIFTKASVSQDFTSDDPVDLKRALQQSESHGRAVCEGGACGHREGGCLVHQPTGSPSKKDKETRDSTAEETGCATDRLTLVIGEFEAGQDGPETNVTVVDKESRDDKSTSGYQSLSLGTEERKGKLVEPAKEPSYDFSPCSAHMNAPQKEKFTHGQHHFYDSFQETIPVMDTFNLQMFQDNFFRERGTTMLPVIKPFTSPAPD